LEEDLLIDSERWGLGTVKGVIGQQTVALAEASGYPGVFGLGAYELDELLLLGEGGEGDGEAKDVGLADADDESSLVMSGQIPLRLWGIDIGR
jgi:hypothetical protein